ncbi:MAG: hypothetical protein MN733_38360 [Nitrososphaera sp.]|nr:hypothetical protein [Nitrososphaera sp.]
MGKREQPSWSWTLSVGAFLTTAISVVWFLVEPGFEPLITVVTSVLAIITYFGLKKSTYQAYLDQITAALLLLVVSLVVIALIGLISPKEAELLDETFTPIAEFVGLDPDKHSLLGSTSLTTDALTPTPLVQEVATNSLLTTTVDVAPTLTSVPPTRTPLLETATSVSPTSVIAVSSTPIEPMPPKIISVSKVSDRSGARWLYVDIVYESLEPGESFYFVGYVTDFCYPSPCPPYIIMSGYYLNYVFQPSETAGVSHTTMSIPDAYCSSIVTTNYIVVELWSVQPRELLTSAEAQITHTWCNDR